MSKQANYRQIGIFVVGAVILLIAALAVFGGGKLFQDNVNAVFYFQESVKGLVVGAPISYRGVAVGQVKEIGLVYEADIDKLFIPVHAELFPGRAARLGRDSDVVPSKQDRIHFFRRMIDKGLRAQLAVDSLVTGQLYISLEFVPESPAVLVNLNRSELEIPTASSGLEQLMGTIKKIPLDQIAGRVQNILAMLDKALDTPVTGEVVTNLNTLLRDSRESITGASAKLSKTLDAADVRLNDPELAKVFKNLNLLLGDGRVSLAALNSRVSKSLDLAEQTLHSLNATVASNSPLQQQLSAALVEIANASRALRLFADYIERHPEAMLTGKARL